MLPNLAQQQQLFLQMLQMQQAQMQIQAAAKQPDVLSMYQAWLLSSNMQQFNPFLQSPISLPNTPLPNTPLPVLSPASKAALFTPSTPSPSLSPNETKRKAVTISDLLDSIPPMKRSCTASLAPASSSAPPLTSLRTSPYQLPIAPPPPPPPSSSTTVSDNNEGGPASIKSRSESSSISDAEPDEFIDVEGEPVAKTKAQRKAHIEFYRKIKLLRNREKQLQCALCNENVENVESTVRMHVTSHAEASNIICKLCLYSSGDLNQMFEHMVAKHPSDRACYEDRRNMTQLSELLSTCFPRGGVTKQRVSLLDAVQKVIDIANKKGETIVTCSTCSKDVQVTKEALTRHMNLHHVYRCKKCKATFQVEEEMQAHCQKAHKISEARSATDYHITAAVDAVGSVFRQCFEKHLIE